LCAASEVGIFSIDIETASGSRPRREASVESIWMNFYRRLRKIAAETIERSLDARFSALIQAFDNQSQMLHEKMSALVQALDNQSDLLNDKLSALSQGLDNQSELINHKLDSCATLELQQAQLVMQRDAVDAIHELARSIRQAKPVQS
jgi:hypothetical protein